MSFQPNDVQRRAQLASGLIAAALLVLLSAFFRAQVLDHARYRLAAEDNRLREVPLPAARGMILDRKGRVIAENVPSYTVSYLARTERAVREMMRRIGELSPVTPEQVGGAIRRYRHDASRPVVLFTDAPFSLVSALEERRLEFP